MRDGVKHSPQHASQPDYFVQNFHLSKQIDLTVYQSFFFCKEHCRISTRNTRNKNISHPCAPPPDLGGAPPPSTPSGSASRLRSATPSIQSPRGQRSPLLKEGEKSAGSVAGEISFRRGTALPLTATHTHTHTDHSKFRFFLSFFFFFQD